METTEQIAAELYAEGRDNFRAAALARIRVVNYRHEFRDDTERMDAVNRILDAVDRCSDMVLADLQKAAAELKAFAEQLTADRATT